MTHVVEQLVNMYPAAKITCALDNDRKSSAEGKGNTGLRTGYDIMEKFSGVKCVYPTLRMTLSRNAAILTTCTA
jgi:putative DNA primase/helicase